MTGVQVSAAWTLDNEVRTTTVNGTSSFGWLGSGHVHRLNLTHAFYQAIGEDTFNPIAGKRVTVNAQMAAAEISYDKDWMRYRVSAFYTSGEQAG